MKNLETPVKTGRVGRYVNNMHPGTVYDELIRMIHKDLPGLLLDKVFMTNKNC